MGEFRSGSPLTGGSGTGLSGGLDPACSGVLYTGGQCLRVTDPPELHGPGQ